MLGDRQDPDLDGGSAAHARPERGHAGAMVAAVGDHRDIRTEQLGVALHQPWQVFGGALLFAFDQDLHRDVASRPTPGAPPRGHDAGLVVGRTAPEQAPVPDRRLERWGLPGIRVGRGLDVVVRVQQDGGGVRRPLELAEHGGVSSVDLEQLGVRDTGRRRNSHVSSAEARTFSGSYPG